jgi:hypothetical protein
MADYSVILSKAAASAAASVGNVNVTATLRRLKIYDIVIGHEAAGDSPFAWLFQRTSANGTRTAVTPTTLNSADGTSSFAAGENHSSEPTYTAGANLLRIPLNQRATFRWVASKPDARIVVPAVLDAGVGAKTPLAGAVGVSTTLMIEE